MVGIAAGNLLGIVQEGWSRERITVAFPAGVREIEARSGYPDDDDVAQAILIAEAAAAGSLDPADLGRRLYRRAGSLTRRSPAPTGLAGFSASLRTRCRATALIPHASAAGRS